MTIPLGHLTNGFNVSQTQWDALVDAINNLYAIAIQTGGSVGSAAAAANVGGNTETLSVSGSGGGIVVTHGLGWTPQLVLVNIDGNPNTGAALYSIHHVSVKGPTQFTVYFGNTFSAGVWTPAGSGQSITFDWLAFKGV